MNGKTLGTAPVQENLTATFTVPFAPGILTALCVNRSTSSSSTLVVVPGISTTLESAGAPAAVALSADRSSIRHDPNDLSFVTASIVDAAGARVPTAAVPISFSVQDGGAGRLVAVGSGDPTDPGSFTGRNRTSWHGRALAILQPLAGASPGSITLTARVPGLKAATIEVATTAAVPALAAAAAAATPVL